MRIQYLVANVCNTTDNTNVHFITLLKKVSVNMTTLRLSTNSQTSFIYAEIGVYKL